MGESMNCSCDVCRLPLCHWDLFFVDDRSVNAQDAHQTCCYCVLTTIWLSKELKAVLYDALCEDLNMDCIDEIVCCLIGKVIYTENEDMISGKKDTMSIEYHGKRKMIVGDSDDECMPIAKKRKLNEISS